MAKYVFDTRTFRDLQRDLPIDIFPSVWNAVSSLMESGIVISSDMVFEEIAADEDSHAKWAEDRKRYFLPADTPVQQEAEAILVSHRGLAEGGQAMGSADPFVVALAKCKNCAVVCEEVRTRNSESPVLPVVCEAYHIECIDFLQFLRNENLVF